MAGQRTGNALLTLAAIVATLLSQSAAFADEAEVAFDIASQELGSALSEFALQSGKDILFVEAEVAGKSAPGISGRYVPTAALELLLADSNLNYRVSALDTVLVSEAAGTEGGDSDPGNGRTAGETPKPVMMAQASAEQNQASRRAETDSDKDEKRRPLEEIIVTGTNIRGIAPESSPVHVYDREDIQISGAATAQEFIQTLPQNFGGGANDSFGSAPGNEQAGFNTSNGSSVNLRGLGSGATLVLLNGRRIAASSDSGGFTDISMIPASAIERVETLTDGASSIYGSDAVAGVVNFILRDDFEGLETSVRYGLGTQHASPEEFRAGVTGGTNWDSGNGLIVYEYYKRNSLDGSDRDFSDDFPLPNDLLPRQDRHSILGSISQQITPDIEFGSDILFSSRNTRRLATFLSGSATGVIIDANVSTDNFNVGADVSWNFASDWYVDLSGNYSKISIDFGSSRSDGVLSQRTIDSDHWSLEAKASGKLFELPGGAVKLAVGGHYRRETFLNVSSSTGVFRDGTREVQAAFGELFLPIVGQANAVPGIQRLELNASGRFEDYSDFGSSGNPKVGLLWSLAEGLDLRASYGTSFKPPTIGQTGALDRGALLAPSSFIDLVLGVQPPDPSLEGAVILYPFGTSTGLNAETSRAFSGGFDYSAELGRSTLLFSSTYFDIIFTDRLGTTPVPGSQNLLLVPYIAFQSSDSFPEGTVVFSPDQQEVDAVLADLNLPLTNVGADPSETDILVFAALTRNLSETSVRGIDFEIEYTVDSDSGLFTLGLDGTYLLDYTQQAAKTTATVELLDTQFNPLNLNLRGRVGLSNSGGFNANLFVNYRDNYHVDKTDTAQPIDSWTTVDLTLSYDTEERYGSPLLDNTVVRLSVINLFDQDPPEAPAVLTNRILGYDPTNASPLGRFVTFEVTKRF